MASANATIETAWAELYRASCRGGPSGASSKNFPPTTVTEAFNTPASTDPVAFARRPSPLLTDAVNGPTETSPSISSLLKSWARPGSLSRSADNAIRLPMSGSSSPTQIHQLGSSGAVQVTPPTLNAPTRCEPVRYDRLHSVHSRNRKLPHILLQRHYLHRESTGVCAGIWNAMFDVPVVPKRPTRPSTPLMNTRKFPNPSSRPVPHICAHPPWATADCSPPSPDRLKASIEVMLVMTGSTGCATAIPALESNNTVIERSLHPNQDPKIPQSIPSPSSPCLNRRF